MHHIPRTAIAAEQGSAACSTAVYVKIGSQYGTCSQRLPDTLASFIASRLLPRVATPTRARYGISQSQPPTETPPPPSFAPPLSQPLAHPLPLLPPTHPSLSPASLPCGRVQVAMLMLFHQGSARVVN